MKFLMNHTLTIFLLSLKDFLLDLATLGGWSLSQGNLNSGALPVHLILPIIHKP